MDESRHTPMMRVLQLNMHYRGAGSDRCARELYEKLPSVGVESAMWVGERHQGDAPGVRGLRRNWEPWLTPLETFPDLTDWRHRGCIEALSRITKDEFDLVHIHNIHSGLFSIRAVHQLCERFPCVWTLHDEWAPNLGVTYDLTGKISPHEVKRLSRGPIRYIPYHRYHENFKWRRTRKFLRRWLPQPRVVICPSQFLADMCHAVGVFPRSEIVRIPNGTSFHDVPEASAPRLEAKKTFGLVPDRPVVMMISADLAQAHKGIDFGIRSIMANAARGLQVLLLGGSAAKLASSIPSIRNVCVFTSNDSELANAYRAADVVLIPSLGENFPYVALESMACETPVIAFPIGGMPEMIGRNERGIVCEKIDADEMSRQLGALLEDPERRKEMGRRGARWVRENCAMDDYLRNIKQTYTQVLGASVRDTPAVREQVAVRRNLDS